MAKMPDLKSTLFAAVIGAIALTIIATFATLQSRKSAAIWGAALGAMVQIAVRIFGIS